MSLLTLDLATRLGWTVGEVADRHFQFGSFTLPSTGADLGKFALPYHQWLHDMIDRNEVDDVVFEAPVLPRETQIATVRKLSGLCWHTEFVCAQRGIEVSEAHQQSVRKFFINSGKGGKLAKALTTDAAKSLGYDVKNDDEADAIALRFYTLARKYPAAAAPFDFSLGALGAAAS